MACRKTNNACDEMAGNGLSRNNANPIITAWEPIYTIPATATGSIQNLNREYISLAFIRVPSIPESPAIERGYTIRSAIKQLSNGDFSRINHDSI